MSWHRKSKMPKPRIPVAKPGIRHKSEKDYVRQKKVEIPEAEGYDDFFDEDWTYESSYQSEMDLFFLLYKLGLKTVKTNREVSYG